jgi:hypothetical protein
VGSFHQGAVPKLTIRPLNPYDVPNFFLKNIDEKGITYLNESAMLSHPNMTNRMCFLTGDGLLTSGVAAKGKAAPKGNAK